MAIAWTKFIWKKKFKIKNHSKIPRADAQILNIFEQCWLLTPIANLIAVPIYFIFDILSIEAHTHAKAYHSYCGRTFTAGADNIQDMTLNFFPGPFLKIGEFLFLWKAINNVFIHKMQNCCIVSCKRINWFVCSRKIRSSPPKSHNQSRQRGKICISSIHSRRASNSSPK